MPLNYNREEPMTVGDLVKALKRVPNDAKVYIVLDKGEQNYNEETGYYYDVHPLVSFQEESIMDEEDYCLSSNIETNVLLELGDEFYFYCGVRQKETPGY